MSQLSFFDRQGIRSRWMSWAFLVGIAAVMLCLSAPRAEAQTPSTLDTMRIINKTVPVGDTFFLDVYLRNVDTLGAFNYRLTYNSALIEPLTDTTISGGFPPDTTISVEGLSALRGSVSTSADPRLFTWETFAAGLPENQILTFIAVDLAPSTPPASTVFVPGAGAAVRMTWRVKAGVSAQTTPVSFENDPTFPSSFNTFTDFRAQVFKRPILTAGAVTITTDIPPPQGAPEVQQPPSPVSVSQGDLLTFPVTATDPDGDSLSLLAFNLPTGAMFTPNNPVKGRALVQGTFRWTPSFSQSGSFVVSFQATDSSGLVSAIRNVTINVVEVPRDLLFTTSAPDQLPQGGVPGSVGVVIPVNFVQVQTSYGVQFDFVYDATAFTPTSVQPSDRLTGFSIYDNLGDLAGRIRIVAFSLNGDPVGAGTSSVLFNIIGSIPVSAVPGAYDIGFENAFESINPDPNVASVELATENGNVFVDFAGDVNLDGRIDVADVINVVGYILGDFTFTQRQFDAADVVNDDLVDVFDLVEIINIIFGAPPFNSTPTGMPATLDLAYDPHDGPNGSYRLSADLPSDVAGAQFDIRYDKSTMSLGSPEWIGSAIGISLYYRSTGSGRVTAVLLRNPFAEDSKIPAGYGGLLRIPVAAKSEGATPSARIDDAKLADPLANKIEVAGISPVPRSFALEQNYPNPFNASTVIRFNVDGGQAVSEARLEVFNILGQKVQTLHDGELPGRGSYTFTWDGTSHDGEPLASGVYFYRLSLGDKNETRKMVLLK